MGKFPIGSVGGFVYFDINTAFHHFVKSTLESLNITNSRFFKYISDPNKFKIVDYAENVIINIPNRIDVYSNSDYQSTYDTLSTYGSTILEKIGSFSA